MLFKPPFRLNVLTNVGKKFFSLLGKHFPKTHPLHKFFNRNYISLPNFKSVIKSKNILNDRQNKGQNIMLIKRELPVPRHKAKPFALNQSYRTYTQRQTLQTKYIFQMRVKEILSRRVKRKTRLMLILIGTFQIRQNLILLLQTEDLSNRGISLHLLCKESVE